MTFTATMSTTISTAVRMWWENHSQEIWILVDIGSLIIDNPGEIFIHTPHWFLNCIFKSGLRPFYSHTDQFNEVNKTKTNWDIWNNRSLYDNYIFGSMFVLFHYKFVYCVSKVLWVLYLRWSPWHPLQYGIRVPWIEIQRLNERCHIWFHQNKINFKFDVTRVARYHYAHIWYLFSYSKYNIYIFPDKDWWWWFY